MSNDATQGMLDVPWTQFAQSDGGAVTCAHPDAAAAGVAMLREGGNAFDALVAMSWALTVVEPTMSGLLGVNTVLVRTADGTVRWLDAVIAPPVGLDQPTLAAARAQKLTGCEVLIPTLVRSNVELLRSHGTLGLERTIEPAIALAADGFTVSPMTRYWFDMAISESAGTIPEIYRGQSPVGSTLAQPAMVVALEEISRDPAGFGVSTNAIMDAVSQAGGVLTAADLAAANVTWREPIAVTVGGWELVGPGWPNCSYESMAIILLMQAAVHDGAEHGSSDYYHLLIEATKIAAQYRIADWRPNMSAEQVSALLAPGRIQQAARGIVDSDHAADLNTRWVPAQSSHTSHLAAVDREGNMACSTQTLGGLFGVQQWADGLPLNGLGAYLYSDDENAPASSRPTPGVPPASILEMLIARDSDGAVVTMGSPGGFVIPTAIAQGLLSVLGGGSLSDAVTAPRLAVNNDGNVTIESTFPEEVIAELSRRGHDVTVTEALSWRMGSLHPTRYGQGRLQSAADPRRAGAALGL